MAFENPSITHHFFQRVLAGGLEPEEERDAFRVVKTALMQGRKETMMVLLKDEHFAGVLQSLSCKCASMKSILSSEIVELTTRGSFSASIEPGISCSWRISR